MSHTPALTIRLAADPVGVPGARRFVVDGVRALGRDDLTDVAALCVSELAGNAALHTSATFMDVTLTVAGAGVRIEVEDDVADLVDAVRPAALRPQDAEPAWEEATTGRGLAIVSMLSADWGTDLTPRGKRVWAQLTDPDRVHEVRPPTRDVGAPGPVLQQLPPGWALVQLAACPVDLSLRQDQHLDELVRELQLMSATQADPRSQQLAAEIQALLQSPGHARATGRRIAEKARAAGLSHVDIDMAMPREFSALVRGLDHAVRRADLLCEENRLLALTSPADIRALRAWMTEQVSDQLDHHSPPRAWPDWLRDHPIEATGV